MSWDGKQFSRALVMLRHLTVREMRERLAMEVDPALVNLVEGTALTDELALFLLLQRNRIEEAVNFLAYAINPREGLWWAYRCLCMVRRDIEEDFAKRGLTPRQRQQKALESKMKELQDTSEIDALVATNKKAIADAKKSLEEEVSRIGYQNPMQRIQTKWKLIQHELALLKAGLSAEDWGDPEGPCIMEDMVRRMQENALRDLRDYADSLTPPADPADSPSARVYEAIRAKTAAVGPAVEKEMARFFPLKINGLPLKATAEQRQRATDAALRWLLVPNDENGELACQAAIAAKNGPESMLAYTAFWSSTNMKSPTGSVPAMEPLPPMGIWSTLLLLAQEEGGEMDYDERYHRFLTLGIECADGTSTWESLLTQGIKCY